MRIHCYETRPDEEGLIGETARSAGLSVTVSSSVPSLATAGEAADCEGVSTLGQGRIGAELLGAWARMGVRYLSTRTIGHNHIDLAAAEAAGIRVCNASYPPDSVADFTVMLILMSLRHYKQAMWRGQVNDFSLGGLQGRNLSELTVGVVGTGNIGARVVRNLSGFGCRILASSRRKNPSLEGLCEYVALEDIFRRSDVITLHVPLTPETHHMVNAETIAKMKDGVVLVNCARGGLTDTEALISGIETLKIGALGIDTAEGEEVFVHGDHRTDILCDRNWFYLHQFRNVIMTQHMAFYTRESIASMVRCGLLGLVEMRDGACRLELTGRGRQRPLSTSGRSSGSPGCRS